MNFVLIVVFTLVSAVLCDDIVEVKQGSLRGHRMTSRNGREIFAFQGIPYAKPPVGELRFKPPQKPEKWNGVLDATKDAPICVQRGQKFEPEFKGQEDCLYINVYTPRKPDSESNEPLDVMFWIHGGGLYFGSGNPDMYGPQYLLDKDVLLVTMNYRLGAMGFFSTGDAACPGNNGLKDQLAALRWVQDNIAAFGGNPNSVTIFGESAGGISVHYHMLSPSSKGLFHRAISQSGVVFAAIPLQESEMAKKQAKDVAKLFNCPSDSSKEIISCLRKQDAEKVFLSEDILKKASVVTLASFPPIIENEVDEADEAFIHQHPMKTLLDESHELVPWMVGITSAEGGLFLNTLLAKGEDTDGIKLDEELFLARLLTNAEDKSQIKELREKVSKFYFNDQVVNQDLLSNLVDLTTDLFFFIGTNTAVKLHSRREATVYYYYFDYHGSTSFSKLVMDPKIDYGVVHCDDLLYLFPLHSRFPMWKKTTQDEHMIDFMTTLWVNFAQKGTPTPSWDPVSSPSTLEYATIDADGLHMRKGLLKERAAFWNAMPIKNKYPEESTKKDEL